MKNPTLMTFAGKHRYLTYLGCALSGLSAVITLVPYLCMWQVVRETLIGLPDGFSGESLVRWGWIAVAFSLLSMIVYFAALMCTHLAAFRTARNLKTVALRHLSSLPIGYFKKEGSGKLRRIIDDGAGQTESYLAHQLPDLAGALVTPIAVLLLLFVFDWRFGLISLLPILVGAAFFLRMMGPGMEEKMSQYQSALDDMNSEAVEYIRGISVVKAFQQSIFSFRSFHDSILRYRDWAVAYTISLRLPMCGYTVSINGIFAALIVGGLLLIGDISQGNSYRDTLLDLIFYILFTPICVSMMDRVMWASENAMKAKDALERILAICGQMPLEEPDCPAHPKDDCVELVDVSFAYEKSGENVLDHVNLRVEPGMMAAIVGPSGGGKTTLASMIPRFFDVDEGRVMIGGEDVRAIGSERLMNLVSFVFQDSRLFKDTLEENVKMARPNASREEVMAAIRAARCEDIVEKLPQGLQTVIGSKGVYLSGGEVQRIALARAILKNTPIVVLDEATAFADPDNEQLIQQALETLIRGKTVLMIAHRLSTICNADRIFVMKDGQIKEQGTHGELLARGGIYRAMWEEYCKSAEWKVG